MFLSKFYNLETKTLNFPYNFDQELINLADNIEIIIFNEDLHKDQYSKFNKSVDSLPSSLTHLTFGYYFDQLVDKLPSSITHLTFGLQEINIYEKTKDHIKKPFCCRIIIYNRGITYI